MMPTIGYGCAGLGPDTSRTVGLALAAGYRHLDSAQAREWYREDLVGKALKAWQQAGDQGPFAHGRQQGEEQPQQQQDGEQQEEEGGGQQGGGWGRGRGRRREDVFLTSKLHPRHLGHDATLVQFNASLAGELCSSACMAMHGAARLHLPPAPAPLMA